MRVRDFFIYSFLILAIVFILGSIVLDVLHGRSIIEAYGDPFKIGRCIATAFLCSIPITAGYAIIRKYKLKNMKKI